MNGLGDTVLQSVFCIRVRINIHSRNSNVCYFIKTPVDTFCTHLKCVLFSDNEEDLASHRAHRCTPQEARARLTAGNGLFLQGIYDREMYSQDKLKGMPPRLGAFCKQ